MLVAHRCLIFRKDMYGKTIWKFSIKCVIKYWTSNNYNVIKQFLKINLMEIQRKALCENVLVIYDLRVLQLHNKYIFWQEKEDRSKASGKWGISICTVDGQRYWSETILKYVTFCHIANSKFPHKNPSKPRFFSIHSNLHSNW